MRWRGVTLDNVEELWSGMGEALFGIALHGVALGDVEWQLGSVGVLLDGVEWPPCLSFRKKIFHEWQLQFHHH